MSDLKTYLCDDSYKSVSVASLVILSLSLLLYLSQFFYLVIFSALITLFTFWITCTFINTVLNQTQPLNVPHEPLKEYPRQLLLSLYGNSDVVKRVLGTQPCKVDAPAKLGTTRRKKIKSFDPLLNTVDGRVHFMSSEVSNRFISSWYRSLINSNEDAFQEEAKFLLDGFFKRLLFVIPFVDTDKLIVEYLAVVLRHLKEYRRAKKRVLKQNSGNVEEIYRYALPQNTNEAALKEHAYKITANTMREFISWELWNSFPCNILIAVLSEKMTLNIINYISDPKWLLQTIHSLLLRTSPTTKPPPTPPPQPETLIVEPPPLEIPTELVHREKPAPIIFVPGIDTVDKPTIDVVDTEAPLILDTSESLNWSHFGGEDKPIEEVTMSYKTVELNVKEYQSTEVISPSTWNMDDFDFISMGQDLLAQTSELNLGKHLWSFAGDLDEVVPKKVTPNEAEVLTASLKEIQQRSAASVSDAMHKIGDLQDEAAGYVEGIIDFGMAGLKKAGLRLTGLQDQPSGIRKVSPRQDTEKLNSSSDSADEIDCLYKPAELEDSPEYEEPTDFASSVAKLKSIIQQKTSSESTGNTPVVSPMYGDGEIWTFPYEAKPLTDNIFARVTGVFNQIRTALPGNVGDIVPQSIQPTLHPMSQRWIFLEETIYDENENFPKLLDSILKERSDFCNVDTAYEAVDGFDLADAVKTKRNSTSVAQPGETSYDGDLDECFSKIPKSHLLMDICCEILKDTSNYAGQEPVVRGVLLLFGNMFEEMISNFSKAMVHKSDSIDSILKNMSLGETKEVEMEDVVTLIEERIPNYVQTLIGRKDIREGIEFVFNSLMHEAINKDICVLMLEILSSKIIQSNNELSPKSPFK